MQRTTKSLISNPKKPNKQRCVSQSLCAHILEFQKRKKEKGILLFRLHCFCRLSNIRWTKQKENLQMNENCLNHQLVLAAAKSVAFEERKRRKQRQTFSDSLADAYIRFKFVINNRCDIDNVRRLNPTESIKNTYKLHRKQPLFASFASFCLPISAFRCTDAIRNGSSSSFWCKGKTFDRPKYYYKAVHYKYMLFFFLFMIGA